LRVEKLLFASGILFCKQNNRETLPPFFERQPSPLYFQSEAAKNIKTSLLQGLSPEKTSPFKP
jgi:hypothetical protein